MGAEGAAASHGSGNVARVGCLSGAAGRSDAGSSRRWPATRGPQAAASQGGSGADAMLGAAGGGAAAVTGSCLQDRVACLDAWEALKQRWNVGGESWGLYARLAARSSGRFTTRLALRHRSSAHA